MFKKALIFSIIVISFFLMAMWFLIYIAKDANFSRETNEKVIGLINETTKDPCKQQAALLALEELGDVAIPYIIGNIGDLRALATREMRTENKFPGAWEHFAHHTPALVHDALSILLVQMTGESILASDGSTKNWQRKITTTQWVAWCVSKYSDKPSLCTKSLRDY